MPGRIQRSARGFVLLCAGCEQLSDDLSPFRPTLRRAFWRVVSFVRWLTAAPLGASGHGKIARKRNLRFARLKGLRRTGIAPDEIKEEEIESNQC